VTSVTHLVRPPVALAYRFDGADDYVDLDGLINLFETLSAYCVEVLVYVSSGFVLSFTRGISINFEGRIPAENRFRYTFRDEVKGYWIDIYDVTEGWYDLVFQVNGTKLEIYHNATLVYSTSISGIGREVLHNSLGTNWDRTRFGSNIIAEVRVYDRILTAEEIGDLFSIRRNIMRGCVLKLGALGLIRGGGTKWLDESPYKSHGTVYGAKRVRCCHCNIARDYGV